MLCLRLALPTGTAIEAFTTAHLPPCLFCLACPLLPAATVDDSLPFILNILLANCASLAGVAVVLCLAQASHCKAICLHPDYLPTSMHTCMLPFPSQSRP